MTSTIKYFTALLLILLAIGLMINGATQNKYSLFGGLIGKTQLDTYTVLSKTNGVEAKSKYKSTTIYHETTYRALIKKDDNGYIDNVIISANDYYSNSNKLYFKNENSRISGEVFNFLIVLLLLVLTAMLTSFRLYYNRLTKYLKNEA